MKYKPGVAVFLAVFIAAALLAWGVPAGKERPSKALEAQQRRNAQAESHLLRGRVLADQKKLDKAIAEYRKALRLKEDYAEAHNALGIALALQSDLESALEEFRQALKLNPDYPAAHYNVGLALERKGDRQGALVEYQVVCEHSHQQDCAAYNRLSGELKR